MSFKFGSSTAGNKVLITPKIVVIGIGGAGCNAVNNMILSGLKGIYFIVANTDAQSLAASLCENRIQLGANLTSGLGAGSSPDVGKRAAEEAIHEIEDYIKDANMLFIAAGMGGGTGTGATPVIAKLAKEMGILTVGVVTKPFHFEQSKRLEAADLGIAELDRYCDTLIVISNQKLFSIANEDTTFAEAFKMADDVLVSGVKCITNLITNPGIVNLDFADVKSVMSSLGRAIMGEGEGNGEGRAIKAAELAIANPLLEHSSIVGATSILINITSGPDITLFEVNDIMQRITKELGNGAISKFGSVIDNTMEGVIRVSIVATGIKINGNGEEEPKAKVIPKVATTPAPQQPKQQERMQDVIKEYPQNNNIQHIAQLKHNQEQDSIKPKQESIFFEDEEESEQDSDFNQPNQPFFIPPAAKKSSKNIYSSATVESKVNNYNSNNGNGLFAKIFNKKN